MGAQAAKIGAQLRQAVADAVKMLALEIDAELRRNTPIDTGHARRNWVPSVGSPNSSEADNDALHSQGVAQILAYTLEQGAAWVNNAVPYLLTLNYGHSSQRPAGWIERSIDAAMGKVQAKLAKAKSPVDISRLRDQYRSEVNEEAAGNIASAYSPFGDD